MKKATTPPPPKKKRFKTYGKHFLSLQSSFNNHSKIINKYEHEFNHKVAEGGVVEGCLHPP